MAAPVTKLENSLSAKWRDHQRAGRLDGVFVFFQVLAFLVFLGFLTHMWMSTGGGIDVKEVMY